MGPHGAVRVDLGDHISIHPSRVGWDVIVTFSLHANDIFQSTHPVWDGTSTQTRPALRRLYFNPPIPCGMGRKSCRLFSVSSKFQSTHPVWDGTRKKRETRTDDDISIHPSRVGWDSKKYMITYISCDSYPFCQIFRLHKMTAYSYS